jgi:hypothetical protein
MRTWEDLNRADTELLRGEFLAQAVSWRAGRPGEVTKETAFYLDASQALQVKELVRRGEESLQRAPSLYRQAEEMAGWIEDPTLKLTSQASIWNAWRHHELPTRPLVSAAYWLKIWKHRRQLARADAKIRLFDGIALFLLGELLIIAIVWPFVAFYAFNYISTSIRPDRYLLGGALIIADLIAAAWILGHRRSWIGTGLALPFMLNAINLAVAAPFDYGFKQALLMSVGAAGFLALALLYRHQSQPSRPSALAAANRLPRIWGLRTKLADRARPRQRRPGRPRCPGFIRRYAEIARRRHRGRGQGRELKNTARGRRCQSVLGVRSCLAPSTRPGETVGGQAASTKDLQLPRLRSCAREAEACRPV